LKYLLLASTLFSVAFCHAGEHLVCVRHMIAPDYPRLARISRLQGSVRVDFKIGPSGEVLLVRGSGADKVLLRSSEENIRQWTFVPPSVVADSSSPHHIVYVYKLTGAAEYYDSPPTITVDLPDKIEIVGHPPEPQP
jgi:TonB family protein